MDNIETLTLFVNELEVSRLFYEKNFESHPVHEDDVSVIFRLGGVMVNLLQETEAAELTNPLKPGQTNSGPRFLLTIRVPDVDRTCDQLRGNGVEILNGPMNRPWGRRTAAFADPDGNVWEIAQEL